MTTAPSVAIATVAAPLVYSFGRFISITAEGVVEAEVRGLATVTLQFAT
jgi:hypothetical protein